MGYPVLGTVFAHLMNSPVVLQGREVEDFFVKG
jgi:hypothetical protein